ncbi:MAG: hypothetical protein JSR79_04890, partial [Proteobacteria bacterium]|nr:hypothetical protein [Pseudomonadota bacterium]
MQPITEDGLSRIVQAFALAAIDPSQWLPALSLVSDATGAVCSSLEYVDLNTGEAAMECSFPLEGSVLRDYEEHIFHINPRVHRTMALPVGKVIDDYQLRWADDPTAAEFRDWLDAMPYSLLEGGKILESRGHVGFFSTHFNGKHG